MTIITKEGEIRKIDFNPLRGFSGTTGYCLQDGTWWNHTGKPKAKEGDFIEFAAYTKQGNCRGHSNIIIQTFKKKASGLTLTRQIA